MHKLLPELQPPLVAQLALPVHFKVSFVVDVTQHSLIAELQVSLSLAIQGQLCLEPALSLRLKIP